MPFHVRESRAESVKHEGGVGICILNVKDLTEILSAKHLSCWPGRYPWAL